MVRTGDAGAGGGGGDGGGGGTGREASEQQRCRAHSSYGSRRGRRRDGDRVGVCTRALPIVVAIVAAATGAVAAVAAVLIVVVVACGRTRESEPGARIGSNRGDGGGGVRHHSVGLSAARRHRRR
jgi:hypothetical protein